MMNPMSLKLKWNLPTLGNSNESQSPAYTKAEWSPANMSHSWIQFPNWDIYKKFPLQVLGIISSIFPFTSWSLLEPSVMDSWFIFETHENIYKVLHWGEHLSIHPSSLSPTVGNVILWPSNCLKVRNTIGCLRISPFSSISSMGSMTHTYHFNLVVLTDKLLPTI